MARSATEIMLGKSLAELALKHRSLAHYGVKEAVFPFYFYPEVDPVLGRRLARIALERAGADPRRVGSRHVSALLELTGAAGGSEIHLPGRLGARKSRGRIVIGPRGDR